ncbi:hypothetical protein MICAI_3430002 [Microcystis sp. T1-4]|nr:hypothetical protein MICAI_3430002 [Microcystis sp. T1-4]
MRENHKYKMHPVMAATNERKIVLVQMLELPSPLSPLHN